MFARRRMTVFGESACLLISLALTVHLTEAIVCQMGQEPDPGSHHRYRWVIPVEDPCKCTKIRLGGINNRAPGRNFKVIYFDTFLISKSFNDIRKWLNCKDPSIPHNEEHTTAFATSDLPGNRFSCVGKDDGRYSDPYNCEMYNECSNGIKYHRSCPDTLQFNQVEGQCRHDSGDNCQL